MEAEVAVAARLEAVVAQAVELRGGYRRKPGSCR